MVHFIPPCQRRLAMLAAQADSDPILISGASGTGKSAIARWIHANSPRAAKPFVIAQLEKPFSSQIVYAQGGSFLIPEISEWPLGEQKTILKFLKTKSVPHTDNNQTQLLLNVRVITTTDHSLEKRAQGGLFNSELLEKLNTFRIEMPPLSKRSEEFEDIVLGIVGEITRELHKEHIKSVSEEALAALRSYEWPGNLRELRNVLRLAVVTAKRNPIELIDFPEFRQDRINFRATREQFEKIYILELLKTYDWQIEKICRMIQLDESTLIAKIKKYGIELKPNPSSISGTSSS